MIFHTAAPPEDLESFWREVGREAAEARLWYRRDLNPRRLDSGHLVETIAFQGVAGEELFGWFAYPEGDRRVPGFLWLPPYGRSTMPPNEFGTRKGFASLSFNHFGLPAGHEERYRPSQGYFAAGIDAPETWIFRRMVQNAYVAARVLQALVEVDEDRIGAMGMSQGGGMAVWLGAICPIVKAVCADMPFLCQTHRIEKRDLLRYPIKELQDYADSVPLGYERVSYTLSYFDTVHVASLCRVPVQVSLGERDPASRPERVEALYDALPEPKRLVRYPVGHEWTLEMAEANREWLRWHLG
ncbi:MAG: acetylxylan esterase [Fimbriimonadales bacterium]|nr:acetylxylan esterase [Fimbriimonadales bacterium]